MKGLDRISLYKNFKGILDRREGDVANYFSERSVTKLSNLLNLI